MTSQTRSTVRDGRTYVGVTSAMAQVRIQTGEPEDYYGPHARIHAAEGEGCHRACIDWLASQTFSAFTYYPPPWPREIHHSEADWWAVINQALLNFEQFVTDYQIEPIGFEQEDFSKLYGLVGHIDLPCYFKIPGRQRMKGPVDLKFTSVILEAHRRQVRCYGKLDGMRDSNMGGIFWSNRNTGKWKFDPVNLIQNLEDVLITSYAAKVWEYGQRNKMKQDGFVGVL